jgi:tetratricopeptide (TPR) repeat protein
MSPSREDLHSLATVNERESSRQAADFAALRRMLAVSQGCFSLSFAVCNDRILRNELVGRLRQEFPGLMVVELPTGTADVYQSVCDRLPEKSPGGIFVLDLEASIPFEARTYPTLKALNSSRELWERLNFPVVFWLADYAAALLATHAPDFWRYRSHQFEFVSDRTRPGEFRAEAFLGFEMVDALPFEEKRFRAAELEERLREAGDPPSVNLLPHALVWTYELAHLYRHLGRFDLAREVLERAVAWSESAYGPNDRQTATALNNLAQLLHETNKVAEAEPLMRQALAIDEGSLGDTDPKVATDLSNLSQLLRATNRPAEAEPLQRRALAIDEGSLGNDHPKVATDLNNLALLLQETDRPAEAEPLLRQALAIDEGHLGKEHPGVADSLNNLATLLQATNRPAEAEPLLRRALELRERYFGPNHPKVAVVLNNLALLLQATNRLAEAESLLRRALAIDERNYGGEHPDVANDLNNLALLLQDTNHLEDAEALLRRSLEIYFNDSGQSGYTHPRLQTGIGNYVSLLTKMGMDGETIANRFEEIFRAIS